MVLLESSEDRKRAPWMQQLVFNKILTLPLDFHLTNFGSRNMATVVVGKGDRGPGGVWGHPPPPPPPAIYIKGSSLSSKQL